MAGSDSDAVRVVKPDEYMVETVGPDGLKHHVGPFKVRADAQAWIDQNPSGPAPEAPACGEKSAPRQGACAVD